MGACAIILANALFSMGIMQANLRISVKDNRRNKSRDIQLRRVPFYHHRQLFQKEWQRETPILEMVVKKLQLSGGGGRVRF